MMTLETQTEKYSDLEIIHFVNGGNLKLFEMLIRRYDPFLYKIGRSYRFNHEDTEDLMQEAYINAYSHLRSFEGRASFKTWLTRIMLNACYHKKHKRSSKNEVPEDDFQKEKSHHTIDYSFNENVIMNKELGHIIENAIHRIPEDYRIVFTLRELNALSVAETAEALEISESNVKVRLSRAKGMLQKEIKKMYSSEEIFEFNLVYCDVMVNRVMAKIYELNALEDGR